MIWVHPCFSITCNTIPSLALQLVLCLQLQQFVPILSATVTT
jgi:hypothetical protein